MIGDLLYLGVCLAAKTFPPVGLFNRLDLPPFKLLPHSLELYLVLWGAISVDVISAASH